MAGVDVPLCVEFKSEDDAKQYLKTFAPKKPRAVVVYVDGACSSNGKKGAAAGVGVFWGAGHKDNVSRPVSGNVHTNNVGELQAIQDALDVISRHSDSWVSGTSVRIMSDSQYSIQAVTLWYRAWKANGWKTSSGSVPANLDTIRDIQGVLEALQARGMDIRLLYTPAHKNPVYGPGNDAADALARQGAAQVKSESGEKAKKKKSPPVGPSAATHAGPGAGGLTGGDFCACSDPGCDESESCSTFSSCLSSSSSSSSNPNPHDGEGVGGGGGVVFVHAALLFSPIHCARKLK
jgi:ribonuclease HI